MRNQKPRPFAFIRNAEGEKMKRLSSNAAKLWVAIRWGRDDTEDLAIGCRDFEAWGLGRTAVSKALKEHVAVGLLKCIKGASFSETKRTRRLFRIVHTRAFDETQSAAEDSGDKCSPSRRTNECSAVRPRGQRQRLQSFKKDIPNETSSTTSRKLEEEEVYVESINCNADQAANLRIDNQWPLERGVQDHASQKNELGKDQERELDQKEWRKMEAVINEVAIPMHMKTVSFIELFWR